jgi:pyruvate carboxylase subunit B
MFGPWKRMVESYGRMVLGYFGKTPVPPDPEVVKIASEQLKLEPTTKTPLELNDADPKKSLEASRVMLREAGLAETDENIFIAAACREKGIAFLKGEATTSVRKKQPEAPKQEKAAEVAPAAAVPSGQGAYTIVLNGKTYAVELQGETAVVNGKTYTAAVKAGIDATAVAAPKVAEAPKPEPVKPVVEVKPEAPVSTGDPVKSPMPGVVFRIDSAAGATVAEGATLVVLEAMKMEIPVKAPRAGVVASIAVAKGDQVTAGQALAWLK